MQPPRWQIAAPRTTVVIARASCSRSRADARARCGDGIHARCSLSGETRNERRLSGIENLLDQVVGVAVAVEILSALLCLMGDERDRVTPHAIRKTRVARLQRAGRDGVHGVEEALADEVEDLKNVVLQIAVLVQVLAVRRLAGAKRL